MKRASGHGAGGASAGTPFCIVLAYDRAGLDCWNALDVVAGGQGSILRSSARDAAWQGDAAFYLQYYESSYVYRATVLVCIAHQHRTIHSFGTNYYTWPRYLDVVNGNPSAPKMICHSRQPHQNLISFRLNCFHDTDRGATTSLTC